MWILLWARVAQHWHRGGIETTYVSARTMRVRLAFSMVNFVLPSCPAMRPGECGLDEMNVDVYFGTYRWRGTNDHHAES